MDVVHSALMKKCTNKPSFCDKIRRLFLFFTPNGNPDQEAVTDLYNDFESNIQIKNKTGQYEDDPWGQYVHLD